MSDAATSISEACSAVAFYGIEPSAKAAEGFCHTVVKWFNELGYPPDRIGVTGPGHSGRKVSFARGSAKLRETGFEGVTDVELVCYVTNTPSGERAYLLTAIYDGRGESADAHFVARSSLAKLSPTSMLPIARNLAHDLKPAYGIGYTREYRFGPDWYAMGINHSGGAVLTGEAYEEARNVSRWCDLGMVKQVWRGGLLRDVYPWNFLTAPHLDATVDGRPLRDWIRQDAQRGSLTDVTDAVVLWDVPEESIPEVRSRLKEAHVLFDWRRFTKPVTEHDTSEP
jgi:hypothetical protein